MSQESLALAAGVERSYVGAIERGDSQAGLLTVAKLCEALDVSIGALMKRAGL